LNGPSDHFRKIDPVHPEPDIIREAGRILKKGGMVIFPTSGLYGLGVDYNNPTAVSRLFQVKHRNPNKPVLILIHDRETLSELTDAAAIPPAAAALMDRFWPGRLTLVLPAPKTQLKTLTGETGGMGVRLCRHPVARALISEIALPITGTSANISGNAGISDISRLDPRIAGQVDLILDAGPLVGGKGSTIVDVTGQAPRIIREGVISARDIFN